jgi:3',5'-cyclic AMP phosphodiesterase CpdA
VVRRTAVRHDRAVAGSLFAVSDLHVAYAENREIVDRLRPESPADWLLVAGDVGEKIDDVVRTLALLRERFAAVVWVPGNHELWTVSDDPVRLRGAARYDALVARCRDIGVTTPEDDYSVWGDGVVVAPIFQLYDYTYRVRGTRTTEESLRRAYEAGVVCTDEYLLHPDPYPDRAAWCRARVQATRERLDAVDPAMRTVLVSHWPLVREPTDVLRHPEFAQWCGTELTRDWHVRYRAAAVVYGHLHIPRTTHYDGVRFEEVSLGYPREWRARPGPPQPMRRILGEAP